MPRVIAVLLIALLPACASQPQIAGTSPGSEHSVITSPDPEAATEATDILMFAERLKAAVALIVASVLTDGYNNPAR